MWSRWRDQLRADLTSAVENGELPAGFDIDQALFEIVAAGLALNAAVRLQHDRALAEHTKGDRAGPTDFATLDTTVWLRSCW